MSLRFRIVFALACAVLAGLLCLTYAQGVQVDADKVRDEAVAEFGGTTVTLVVANEGLEPGDVIDETKVREREWASDLAPEGALTSMDSVLGRTVTSPVARNAPLTDLSFRDASTVAEVPAGHVAVAVPLTDKLGISRETPAGSAVVAYRVGKDSTSLLAADMRVLSQPAAQVAYGTGQVTLSARPDDVPGLLAASAAGELRLALPAGDVTSLAAGEPAAPEPVATETGEDAGGDAGGEGTVAPAAAGSAGTD